MYGRFEMGLYELATPGDFRGRCQLTEWKLLRLPLYWNCGASTDQRHSRSTGSRRFGCPSVARPFCSLRHGRPHYTIVLSTARLRPLPNSASETV